jgi:hypothetical protein
MSTGTQTTISQLIDGKDGRLSMDLVRLVRSGDSSCE